MACSCGNHASQNPVHIAEKNCSWPHSAEQFSDRPLCAWQGNSVSARYLLYLVHDGVESSAPLSSLIIKRNHTVLFVYIFLLQREGTRVDSSQYLSGAAEDAHTVRVFQSHENGGTYLA
jgi:hypothetical protein